MKAHRSLQRTDLLKHSPDKIALMVASEFLRASSRSAYPQIVSGCLERARELMGVLETLDLAEAAADLQPAYYRCTNETFMVADKLSPEKIQSLGLELAQAFEQASHKLGQPHA